MGRRVVGASQVSSIRHHGVIFSSLQVVVWPFARQARIGSWPSFHLRTTRGEPFEVSVGNILQTLQRWQRESHDEQEDS